MWLQIGVLLALVLGAVIGFIVGRVAKRQDMIVAGSQLIEAEVKQADAGFAAVVFLAGEQR